MPQNIAMGETGIANFSNKHINIHNPSGLIYNSLSAFQVGMELERRNFTGGGTSGMGTDAGLKYIGYSFPIKTGKWNMAFGLHSLSTVSYNTFSSGFVEGASDDVEQVANRSGDGGLTNFYWAHGFRIYKNLYLGVKGNATFGSIVREELHLISGYEFDINISRYENEESYSDLNLLIGASYFKELSASKFLIIGAIYSPHSAFDRNQNISLLRLSAGGSELQNILISKVAGTFDYPSTIGVGFSYNKANKYTISFDMETQNWKISNPSFNNYFKIAVGGRYIPDYSSVSSYFKRIRYMGGLNYQRLPYVVNEQTITDIGINFGVSLPVGFTSAFDLVVKMGQTGTTTNNLIRESYIKIVLGAVINDRWFIQRKYD